MASSTISAGQDQQGMYNPACILELTEDALFNIISRLASAEKKSIRLTCKAICLLANSTCTSICLDRTLQLTFPHSSTPSTLSLLSRLPSLSSCSLSQSLNPSHLPSLLSLLPALTAFKCNSVSLPGSTLPALSLLSRLQSLQLTTTIPPVSFRHSPPTLPLNLLTSLTHLDLQCANQAPASPDPLPGLSELTSCPNLQSLILYYSTSSRFILDGIISASRWFSPLSKITSLTSLTLNFDPSWHVPADLALPPLETLTHLVASPDCGAILLTLDSCPNLLNLEFLPPRKYPPNFSSLSWPQGSPCPLPHLTHLTAPGDLLALRSCPRFPSLASLNMKPVISSPTTNCKQLLCAMAQLPQLRELAVAQAEPDSPEIRATVQSVILQQQSLQALTFSGWWRSSPLPHLHAHPSLPTLQALNLTLFSPNTSQAQKELELQLREAAEQVPGLDIRIEWEEYGQQGALHAGWGVHRVNVPAAVPGMVRVFG